MHRPSPHPCPSCGADLLLTSARSLQNVSGDGATGRMQCFLCPGCGQASRCLVVSRVVREGGTLISREERRWLGPPAAEAPES